MTSGFPSSSLQLQTQPQMLTLNQLSYSLVQPISVVQGHYVEYVYGKENVFPVISPTQGKRIC